ncbi:Activity-dependent neuroprotector homeobox protein 2 [Dissostichus eleginoides]|uniref:Activity-dependent neuroprotector homeobox protein 2 n=1 Tax=Dissostichus eleginoides TaxID=100907 RepID=A0AAD9BCJ7_DISEL|nr:Activity-dependent neuroprotector homeobox protein 2 [Dissostichus eleginoides]
MYQYPVGNIDKIRKARKAVKTILGEIGLEDCQKFLKDLDENTERDSDEEEVYQETDWVDVTDGYNLKPQKKWPYRSQTMCCSVCKYSSRNLYNFRSHISRCHVYLQSFCTLAPCSKCIFIAHPQVVMRHMQYFHSTCMKPQKEAPPAAKHGNERYYCRRCGWPGSSIFTMKKHVILKHLDKLSEQYIGYRLHPNGANHIKVYCCKVCKVNTGNLDQMLHHMLVEPSHYTVSTQVQALIHENKTVSTKATPNGNGMFVTFPNIAPKPQQPQMFKNNSLIIPSNGQPGRTVVTLQQLQAAANNGTLICAPGTNQAFLPPQASALVQLASAEAKGLLQPGATISLRSALPQGSNMVNLPAMSNIAIAPAPLKQTAQTQQIFIQSGPQSNVAAQTGTQPALVTQNTPANQMTLQGTMLTSESLLSHLIPNWQQNERHAHVYFCSHAEKSVFQHLLHGLNCLYCSALFFSIKQLAEHVKQHNPTSKAYCDFLRQKYRVYSKGVGGILFPYFDVNTTAPREVLGDTEVNLALVTSSLDLIFFKLQPSSQPEICSAPAKINSSYCPFCDEKFQNESDHLQHLKQKHLVAQPFMPS